MEAFSNKAYNAAIKRLKRLKHKYNINCQKIEEDQYAQNYQRKTRNKKASAGKPRPHSQAEDHLVSGVYLHGKLRTEDLPKIK
jgi:hypothetical protein